MKKYNNVSMVITSCGRFDLLERTIKSIPEDILSNLHSKLIIDDSGDSSFAHKLVTSPSFCDFTKIINASNIGQPKSVDKIYSLVNTEFVLHCEDDWVFHVDYDFISESINILKENSNILQVTFRKDEVHPSVQSIIPGVNVRVPGWNNEWFGFTYNPSIIHIGRRSLVPKYSGMNEQTIGYHYYSKGLLTASIKGIVSHIGWGRTTNSHIKL